MMLGLETGSLAGAAGIKHTSHDTSACMILRLGAPPQFLKHLHLRKWKLTFLKNSVNSAARTRSCQEIIQSAFR